MTKISLFAAVLLLLSACSQQPGYEISGKVNNPELNGQYVYLYEYGTDNTIPLDSALVQNGSFTLKGEQQQDALRVLKFSEDVLKPERGDAGENAPYSAFFVLQNGKINVILDSSSYVSGTPENDNLKAFQQEVASYRKDMNQIIQDLQSDNPLTVEAAEKRYNEIDRQISAAAKKYISNNTTTLSGGKILHDFRYNLTEEERRDLVDKADETFISVPGMSGIIDHLEVLKKVAVGEKFTDFEMADTKGEMHKLSEYVGNGKVVLIDFWASWCPPCRREMPNLVAAYDQYKKKGFEIVGVSLDSSKEAWEKGIKDLGITWPQLSDLKGWKNSGAALYGVNLIPHVLLIDKDGTILAKNLHGEDLEGKLKEIFQ